MPYIKQDLRKHLEPYIIPLANQMPDISIGELNYIITRLVDSYAHLHETKSGYATYNEILGILEAVKQEFYRRVITPYEKDKCEENGEVFL